MTRNDADARIERTSVIEGSIIFPPSVLDENKSPHVLNTEMAIRKIHIVTVLSPEILAIKYFKCCRIGSFDNSIAPINVSLIL